MEIKAVIFDLDGTVLDNEDEYGEAFRKVLKSLGKNINLKYPHVGGIGVEENWPILIRKYKVKTNKKVHELAGDTQENYLSLLKKVDFKPGFLDFIKKLKKDRILCALATSNIWLVLEKIIDRFNLEGYFDCMTTGEEVVNKKPYPDIFNLTLEKLLIDSDYCLVIEDSAAGIEAAHRAGLKVVALARNSSHKKSLNKADKIVSSYNQITKKAIEKL
jgi:HAD superfamily hydrolase (TIGR01509 family)